MLTDQKYTFKKKHTFNRTLFLHCLHLKRTGLLFFCSFEFLRFWGAFKFIKVFDLTIIIRKFLPILGPPLMDSPDAGSAPVHNLLRWNGDHLLLRLHCRPFRPQNDSDLRCCGLRHRDSPVPNFGWKFLWGILRWKGINGTGRGIRLPVGSLRPGKMVHGKWEVNNCRFLHFRKSGTVTQFIRADFRIRLQRTESRYLDKTTKKIENEVFVRKKWENWLKCGSTGISDSVILWRI